MYFIGVTTRQSSINQVFPLWAEELGLGDCELRGLDFPLHAEPERYRAAVEFIKKDPLSLGALITSHKIDVCSAALDLFEDVDPLSRSLGEISSIYKRDGRLCGRTVDPWTSGYALEAFLPRNHWATGAEVLILGAGGAGSALAWHLAKPDSVRSGPRRIHAADRVTARLEHLQQQYATWQSAVPIEYHHVPVATAADELLARLPAGSLVVNATGAGKDTPGSPITSAAFFPERGLVWEFNYRGKLDFLEQARAQQQQRDLYIEDGWNYFLHGWTRVMSDVFGRKIPTRGPVFEKLGAIAASARSA
jgi:shikimate 5-dehydrogenase